MKKKKELFLSACKIFSVLIILAGLIFLFIKGDFDGRQETFARILVCILGACILAILFLLEKSDRDWKKWRKVKEHNKKLSKTKMVLDQREKVMILDSLLCDEYKDKVREPKTPHFIRLKYRGLLAKFKASIKEF